MKDIMLIRSCFSLVLATQVNKQSENPPTHHLVGTGKLMGGGDSKGS